MIRLATVLLLIAGALAGCTRNSHDEQTAHLTPPTGPVSGITPSYANPGMLWVTGNNAGGGEVYLIDTLGNTRMTCQLANTKKNQWQALAMGTGRGSDSLNHFLYIAAIGDTANARAVKEIYRLEEPVFDAASKLITDFDTLYVRPDDGPRHARAFLIDPVHHAMYMLSHSDDSTHFYKIDYPFTGDTLTARFRVKLPFRHITAAAVSRDGTQVLIKNAQAVYYWQRNDFGPISKLMQTTPHTFTITGSAICFAEKDAHAYIIDGMTLRKHVLVAR